jgi:2'-phosphotransferase
MAQPNTKEKRGRGHGQGQSRDVQVSKALSLLLRHAAEKEGLKMNAQGYASVPDVVCSFIDLNSLRYN